MRRGHWRPCQLTFPVCSGCRPSRPPGELTLYCRLRSFKGGEDLGIDEWSQGSAGTAHRRRSRCRRHPMWKANRVSAADAVGVAVWAHRSQRRFSQRTTGLPWNLTFADATKNVSDCDSSRSRMPNDDRDNFGAERLHPMVTMQRCRPQAVTRRSRFRAAKPNFADRASDWGWPTRCPVAASSVCERGIDRPDGVLSNACAGTFQHRQQISPAHPLVQPAADRDG